MSKKESIYYEQMTSTHVQYFLHNILILINIKTII